MLAPRPSDLDAAIRSTDNDAAQARLSAVRKGYLQDPFINYFVKQARFIPPRPPLINIGTYLRSEAIDALVNRWLQLDLPGGEKQIVSLGAGSDTRFWRINQNELKGKLSKYIEIDFPEVTGNKIATIRKHQELQNIGSLSVGSGGTALSSDVYHIIPADLRLTTQQTLDPLLQVLSPELPTLFIAECVFAYMEPSISSGIMRWFSEHFDIVGGIIYEMFGLDDPFGRVMRDNLKARNVQLPGVGSFSSLESLKQRFQRENITSSFAITLKDYKGSYLKESEKLRISTLEFLDEVEELDLVLEHYALSWGWATESLRVEHVNMDWSFG